MEMKSVPMSMTATMSRVFLLAAALALAGCNESSYQDFSAKAEKPLPPKVLTQLKAKGMERNAPVMARIFKEEGKVEIWKQKTNGRYDVIATYDICKWSGKLGPKFIEGDRQAPEGFYTVRPSQMNPKSSYHLAFNIGYPNAYDRAHGRTGTNLMVHGACSSSGCYSMTDAQIEEIYAFGRDAFKGGQTEFQIQAFPFRMTPANMARYRQRPEFRVLEESQGRLRQLRDHQGAAEGRCLRQALRLQRDRGRQRQLRAVAGLPALHAARFAEERLPVLPDQLPARPSRPPRTAARSLHPGRRSPA